MAKKPNKDMAPLDDDVRIQCDADDKDGLVIGERTDPYGRFWADFGEEPHKGEVVRIALRISGTERGFVILNRQKVDDLITILEYWKRLHD